MYRCGSTSIPSNSLLPSVINLRAPIRRKAHIRAFEQRGEEASVSVAGFGCARRVGASRLPGCRGILLHFFAVFFRRTHLWKFEHKPAGWHKQLANMKHPVSGTAGLVAGEQHNKTLCTRA